MGGRGAKSNRTNPYGVLTKAALARDGVQISGGGGGSEVSLTEAVGSADFPQIKNFTNSNIVSFKYDESDHKGDRITIRDDRGRIYEGTHAGSGASRDTYSFKEGFVLKFDGLHAPGWGFKPGVQNAGEVKAYQQNKTVIERSKNALGKTVKTKYRAPRLLAAYDGKSIKLPNGQTRSKVGILIMSKAKGGHDTGVKFNSAKGRNLMKRFDQYVRALGRRGISTGDFSYTMSRNGNLYFRNIYRDRKTGKLTLVDLGL